MLHDWEVQISTEQKELVRWNKNHFSSFLDGFQLSKSVSDLRVTLLFFLKQKYVLFPKAYLFKVLKNLITSTFFLPRQILKNRYTSAKARNAALVKLADWNIKNDHVVNCAMIFYKWFKHGQTSNVIWFSSTWLLIYWLVVANNKCLFNTKSASTWTEIFC